MVNMRIFCTGRTLQNTFLIHLMVKCGKTVIILWQKCPQTWSKKLQVTTDLVYFFLVQHKFRGVKPHQLWFRNGDRKYISLARVHKFKVVWVVVRHVRWDGVASGNIADAEVAPKPVVWDPLSEIGWKICETWGRCGGGRLLGKGGLAPGKWRGERVSDIGAW